MACYDRFSGRMLVSRRSGSWILHYVKSTYSCSRRGLCPLSSCRTNFDGRTSTIPRINLSATTLAKRNILCRHAQYSALSYFSLVSSFCYLPPPPLVHGIFGIQRSFYVAFAILSNLIEDPSFKLVPTIHIVNVIPQYFYPGSPLHVLHPFVRQRATGFCTSVHAGYYWICADYRIHDGLGVLAGLPDIVKAFTNEHPLFNHFL